MANAVKLHEVPKNAPTVSTMTVTPAMAQDWIAKNTSKNRRINHQMVLKYVEDIRADRWQLNGSTIVMSSSGAIIDGQHRLLAIIEAARPIVTMVASGIDDEAFETIDTGRPRTPEGAALDAASVRGSMSGMPAYQAEAARVQREEDRGWQALYVLQVQRTDRSSESEGVDGLPGNVDRVRAGELAEGQAPAGPVPAHGVGTPDQHRGGHVEVGPVDGLATHYCIDYERCSYAGQPMGCGGTYDPYGLTVAVGPANYGRWPCGTRLQVCSAASGRELVSAIRPRQGEAWADEGDGGDVQWLRCITAVRTDSCPGCHAGVIDLTEFAFEATCGDLSRGVCNVTISVVDWGIDPFTHKE